MDATSKRANILRLMEKEAANYIDVVNRMVELKAQRDKLQQPYVVADFTSTEFLHMDVGMVGTFFDFVVPSIQTNLIDAANTGRNQQILEQVRP